MAETACEAEEARPPPGPAGACELVVFVHVALLEQEPDHGVHGRLREPGRAGEVRTGHGAVFADGVEHRRRVETTEEPGRSGW